tara:strand:- start:335 stop:1246 length:912 start_codon:yes stop_codon:yes gene_type:complete
MMAEHTSYQEQNFRDIQAGGFKKRSLLDRLNPFTPFSSKKFVPTAKGQEFLDKFKKDTGKNLVVLPIEQKAIDEMKDAYGFTASGYFTPRDIVGGSRDPFNRYVYLDPKDPSLYTLAHEGGHAQDKNLLYDPYQRERRILSRRGQHTRKPPSSYEEFIKGDGKGAMDVFKDELTAEKYARDYFQNKNLQKPSEAMALNYEIAKGEPFPYDKYKKFNIEAFPTDYPMSFLQNYLGKKDDFYNVRDEGRTAAGIRAEQKFYDDYLDSDFRKDAFQSYLNPAYQLIRSQGMDDERSKKIMGMNLGF